MEGRIGKGKGSKTREGGGGMRYSWVGRMGWENREGEEGMVILWEVAGQEE